MAEAVTAKKTATKPKGKGNKKVIIIGGIALLVAGAGYGVYYLLKRKKETGSYFGGSSTSSSSGGGGRSSGGFSCSSKDYPLSYGTCHPDVGILQKYLKKMYKADLGSFGANRDGVDEQFGKVTKSAALKHLKKVSFTQKDITSMKAALKFA